jgi:hypothetical protein
MLGPGGHDAAGSYRTDAVNFSHSVGRRLDDVEYLLAEGAHELLGINGANTPDHAGR